MSEDRTLDALLETATARRTDLTDAAESLDERQAAVEDVGADRLRTAREARDELTALLDRYEEPATGTGDFEEFIHFQGEVATLVEDLPDDVPEREAFEAVSDILHKRQLRASHFERARERLAPVADLAERLERRDVARERYRSARGDLREVRERLRERVRHLEDLAAHDGLDLDADLSPLREPIDAYDAAVTDAFDDFRREAPAREVVGWAATVAADFPLAGVSAPPDDLREFLRRAGAGEEPLPTVAEYADYSRSKLDHYVADPGRFLAAVGGNRTYLDRLDGTSLTVGWPPPPAAEVRHRAAELVAAVGRFADDEAVARCRAVREVTRRGDYERLRRVAVVRESLSDADRERVAAGRASEDLERAREALDAVEGALEAHPER